MSKIFNLGILVTIVSLVLLSLVSADSSDYLVEAVYVNGISEGSSTTIQAELGTDLPIVVFLQGTGETTDVRVRAWIGGYEYGEISAATQMFDVEDSVMYKKYLKLEIPKDIKVDDSHDYTLHIEIFDDQDREEVSYVLYLEEPRHRVNVKDLLLSSTTVHPGSALALKVRLENLGENDEKDLKVTAYIPDIGVSTRMYLDDLPSREQGETRTVFLSIPPSTPKGEYVVFIQVAYNNEYTTTSAVAMFTVDGKVSYDNNVLVSVTPLATAFVGEEKEVKVQVTNLEERTKRLNLFVSGLGVDETQSTSVSGKSTAQFIVKLNPKETGQAQVFIEVKSDDGTILQKVYLVNVEEKSRTWVPIVFIIIGILVVSLFFVFKKRISS